MKSDIVCYKGVQITSNVSEKIKRYARNNYTQDRKLKNEPIIDSVTFKTLINMNKFRNYN